MTEWEYGSDRFWGTINPDGVKTCLEGGRKANARIMGAPTKKGSGRTPLHGVAASSPYPEIVSILVNAETNAANINARLGTGRTPLHVAIASFNTIEMVIALLENKANPNARDENGQTPLHLVAQIPHNSPELLIMTLLKYKADGALRDVFGKIPFDYAKKNTALENSEVFHYTADAYWELRESYWELKQQEITVFTPPPNPQQT